MDSETSLWKSIQPKKWFSCSNLLDNLSQLSTELFQSHVWRLISKARPAGHRTAASRIVPANPARSHLPKKTKYVFIPRVFLRILNWIYYLTTSLQSPSVVSLKYSSDCLSLQSSSGDKFRSSSSGTCLFHLSKTVAFRPKLINSTCTFDFSK